MCGIPSYNHSKYIKLFLFTRKINFPEVGLRYATLKRLRLIGNWPSLDKSYLRYCREPLGVLLSGAAW